MREAALNASTYPDSLQKAVAFHEQRVGQITDGDHDLDDREPQLVAHILPEGSPSPESLSSETGLEHSPPGFTGETSIAERHKYGEITESPRGTELRAYNLNLFAGGVETVSGKEVSSHGDEELFLASRTEAKLAATVNWAQEAFEESEPGSLIVLVTLIGVEGEKIRIPDRAKPRTTASDVHFNSNRINPWPVKVPVGSTGAADSYNQLSGMYDRLWTDAGLTSSIFYRNGSDAVGVMRDYLD